MIPLEILPLILFGATAFLFVVVFALLIRTELRLKKLLRGKKAKDLEDTLLSIQNDFHALVEESKKRGAQIKNLDGRVRKSVKKVSIVRFNPFRGTSGSNQSFAAAFLDESGNGAVISSLYSREKVSVFAKPVKNRQSEYELSKEEKEAINRASRENS